LRLPRADRTRPAPLLLEIHGGPFAAYGSRFDLEKQWYAARGMNVLYVNPRGSTGYGEAFSLLIDKKYPGDDAQDLLAAVEHCVAQGIADPKRLYVAGGSGGGLLTCHLTTITDRFRAAVSLYPVVDWPSQILTSDVGPWIATRWVKGNPWDAAAEQHARSPLAGVARVKTPTRLQVGEQDHRTPPDQAIMWFQALQMRGVESDLLTYPGASHGIGDTPSHWLTSVQWTLDWFERH
jgi:acylaminoacyl-peptidase